MVIFAAFALAACSDDTSGSGGQPNCDVGERWNEIQGVCEPARSANNGGTNNGGTNNGGLNNGGTNNGGSLDGGTNNGGSPDAGTNNGGSPDAGTDATNNGGTDDTGVPQPDAPAGCGPGAIVGKACAPSGEVLAGASVTIEGFDCDGNPYTETVQTDASGEFRFNDVPAGQHTLTISTGSFSRNQTIIVQNGETLDLSTAASKVCLDGGSVNIAVIGGAYDHVSGILDDLQLSYDVKGDDKPSSRYSDSVAFLTDLQAMNAYDIIFINCGELWNQMQANSSGQVSTVINNLKSFLNAGHSLYVSDWSHPFIEKVFADAVDFHGDDNTINDARRGFAPQAVSADVASSEMQTVLGQNTAVIEFPHNPQANPPIINNHWVIAEGAGASSTVHLSGDALLCPTPFGGAFGDPCSNPDGTQADAPLLVTYDTPGGGTAIFTSFHNERQSTLNQDMERILKFLIFQL